MTDGERPDRRVRVVDWRPEWAQRFEDERVRLAGVFENVPVEIEHIGSTAVRGLVAKPVIDITIGVEGLDVVEERMGAIEALGYTYVPQYEDLIPDRRYFRRPVAHPRTHHVHCFVLGSPEWNRHVEFRDLLRSSPALKEAYVALKHRLVSEFGDNREGYTEAKSSFIENALATTQPTEPNV